MSDFRESTKDRHFNQTFKEDPESGILQSHLSDVNERYERLKLKCNQHTLQILHLLSLHERYGYAVESVMTWIEEIQLTIEQTKDMQPGQDQIDALKVSET